MRPPVRVDFQVGDKVEVMSSDEGFVGSFYEGTIINRLENGRYVVRYKTLVEEDGSTPLVETLYPREIRPVPPRVRTPEFTPFQYVDAFDNDGWWMGRISRKIPGKRRGKGCRYTVYFTSTHEELPYPPSRIRLHQEWASGEWLSFN